MEDLELFTHSNDTLGSLRRQILRRIKPGVHCKLELFVNGEPLDTADDRKLLSQVPIRDKMVSQQTSFYLKKNSNPSFNFAANFS